MRIVVLVKAPRRSPDSTERIAALAPCDFAALSWGVRLKQRLLAAGQDRPTAQRATEPDAQSVESAEEAVTDVARAPASRTAGPLEPGNPGEASLVVITAGPSATEAVLRETLLRGADDAYRVWPEDPAEEQQIDGNVRAIAELLSKAIAHVGYDIIIAGDHSADWSSGITGPAVAFNLRIPHCTSVVDIAPGKGDGLPLRLTYTRNLKKATFGIKLPLLVTTADMQDTVRPAPSGSTTDRTVKVLSTVEVGFEPDDPLPWDQEAVTARGPQQSTLLADAAALLARLRDLGAAR